ncbi:hypothetical protein D3C87_1706740 [compost metagenome]
MQVGIGSAFLGKHSLQPRRFLRIGDHHAAALLQQRYIGKAFGRLIEEGLGDRRELAHFRGVVTQDEFRGGAAGAVIAEPVFPFDDGDGAVRRQEIGKRQTGNATANDSHIKLTHVPTSLLIWPDHRQSMFRVQIYNGKCRYQF